MQNVEAEEYVLGCILNEPEIIKELKLSPIHFTDKRKTLYKTMLELEEKNESISMASIMTYLDENQRQLITPIYLTDLEASIPSVEPIKQYEKYILNAWKLRESYKVVYQAQENFQSRDLEAISNTIKKLSEIDETGYEQDKTIKDKLFDLLDAMEEDKGDITGIDTGFIDINTFTDGFQNGDLIVLGATPSMGKTALAGNFALNALRSGASVDFFNFEMAEDKLLKRFISNIALIDLNKLKNPKKKFEDSDWKKNTDAIVELSQYPFYIHNQIMNIQEMRGTVRNNMKKGKGKHLVIVDYLQKIKVNSKDSRNLEVSEISSGLKNLAKDLNVPVIAIASLKRGIDQRSNKIPVMSDLRDSGNIEFDADLIMFLYREEYYEPTQENKGQADLIIEKNRNGQVGTIPLYAELKHSLFRSSIRIGGKT